MPRHALGFIFLILSVLHLQSVTYAKNTDLKNANIILIVLDTFRRDFISRYQTSPSQTPNIDMFLEKSIEYRDAYTRNTYTLPSHTTMMSGLTPRKHGIRKNGQILSQSVQMAPEILKQAGYTTAAFFEIAALNDPSGFSRGFDIFQHCQSYHGPTIAHVSNWLQTLDRNPFFLLINLSTVHVSRELPRDVSPLYVGFSSKPPSCMRANRELETIILVLPPGESNLVFDARHLSKRDDLVTDPLRMAVWDLRLEPSQDISYSWASNVEYAERVEYLVFPPEWTPHDIIFQDKTELHIRNNSNDDVLARIQFRAYPDYYIDVDGDRIQYGLSVVTADSLVGELMSIIQKHTDERKTVVILTSDHGEGLDDHRDRLHGHEVYEESAHVPLGILIPGRKPESRRGLVPLDALAPTLLDIAGQPIPDMMYQRSLAEMPWTGDDYLISETYIESKANLIEPLVDDYSVRSDSFSLVYDHIENQALLFDRIVDPFEQTNISKSQAYSVDQYKATYTEFKNREQQDVYQSRESDDPELIEALRKLGYVE